jgi:transposase
VGYQIEDSPTGFESWMTYWRSKGLAETENYDGDDSIVDPSGAGPRIWFQQVQERKVVKNRVHLTIHASGGRDVPAETRKERVDGAADRWFASARRDVELWESQDMTTMP